MGKCTCLHMRLFIAVYVQALLVLRVFHYIGPYLLYKTDRIRIKTSDSARDPNRFREKAKKLLQLLFMGSLISHDMQLLISNKIFA